MGAETEAELIGLTFLIYSAIKKEYKEMIYRVLTHVFNTYLTLLFSDSVFRVQICNIHPSVTVED